MNSVFHSSGYILKYICTNLPASDAYIVRGWRFEAGSCWHLVEVGKIVVEFCVHLAYVLLAHEHPNDAITKQMAGPFIAKVKCRTNILHSPILYYRRLTIIPTQDNILFTTISPQYTIFNIKTKYALLFYAHGKQGNNQPLFNHFEISALRVKYCWKYILYFYILRRNLFM